MTRRDLSERTKRLIRGQLGDLSTPQAFVAAINGMIAAGWPLEEIRAFFEDSVRADYLPHLSREQYGDQFNAVLDDIFTTAIPRRRKHAERCGTARRIVVDHWRGAHPAPFRTLIALYDIAENAGTFSPTASHRQIAEAAGLGSVTERSRSSKELRASTATVSKALTWLHEQGLLMIDHSEQRPGERNALTIYHLPFEGWLFDLLDGRKGVPIDIPSETPESVDDLAIRHGALCGRTAAYEERNRGTDSSALIGLGSTWHAVVWEPAVLGLTPCRCWHLLTEGGASSVMRIAQRLGLTERSIRDALRRLSDEGLVRRLGVGVYEAVSTDLDALAVRLGVADRRDRRVRWNMRHRRQRDRPLLQIPLTDLTARQSEIVAHAVAAMLGAPASKALDQGLCAAVEAEVGGSAPRMSRNVSEAPEAVAA